MSAIGKFIARMGEEIEKGMVKEEAERLERLGVPDGAPVVVQDDTIEVAKKVVRARKENAKRGAKTLAVVGGSILGVSGLIALFAGLLTKFINNQVETGKKIDEIRSKGLYIVMDENGEFSGLKPGDPIPAGKIVIG